MAATPYLIFHSTYARSYSLTLCLSLLICLISKNLLDNYSPNNIIFLSLLSAIGLLTIPTMILPISGLYLWLILNLIIRGLVFKNLIFKYLIPLVFLTAIFTLILYIPTILLSGGIDSIVNAKFTEPIGIIATLEKLPNHFNSTLSELTIQIPFGLLLLMHYFF